MKRLASILFLFAACAARAGWLDTTNHTRLTTWSDSFSRSVVGQRQNFILGSYAICYSPTNFNTYRDHSAGGHNNIDMAQTRMPESGVPDIALLAGKTNALDVLYVSGNFPTNRIGMSNRMADLLKYPVSVYNQSVNLTNDFPVATSIVTNYHQMLVIDDLPYDSADGQFGGVTLAYNAGGNDAATNAGVHFVTSFQNLSNSIVPRGDKDSLYWTINSPHDHPGNEVQCCWVLTTLTNALCDSNTFSCVIDFNAAVARETNHLTIGSVSLSGSTLTLNNFKTDRMAPTIYVPDGVTTNDMRGAFALMPTLTNTFNENLRVTNLLAGNYRIVIDDTYTLFKTSDQLAAGVNLWLEWTNQPWDAQARSILYLMCDLLDVSRTDQATDPTPGDNRLLINYESQASAIWPTNILGNTAYTGFMKQFEDALGPTDVAIHAAAQQTNHTVTITLQQTLTAPTATMGTVHWGQ